MKSKQPTTPTIRAPNQKSIPSTFIFRTCPKINGDSSIDSSKRVENRSRLSLSAFLDRKLNPTSVRSVDMKKNRSDSSEAKKKLVSLSVDQVDRPNLSPSVDNDNQPNASIFRDDRYRFGAPCEEPTPAIEDSVFKLFNGTQAGKAERTSSEAFSDTPRSESSIRKHSRNHLVVLGDDPRPKRRANSRTSSSNKKPRPFYNHYENGTGWWDPEREGVDNDEVGTNEVWEGMGTTTLGGLDQHF